MALLKVIVKCLICLVAVAVLAVINYQYILGISYSSFSVIIEKNISPEDVVSHGSLEFNRSNGGGTNLSKSSVTSLLTATQPKAATRLSPTSTTRKPTTKRHSVKMSRPSPKTTPVGQRKTTPQKSSIPQHPIPTGFLVNSSACQMFDYDPWDATVADIIRKEKRFIGCRQKYPVRMEQNGTILTVHVNETLLSPRCNVTCCYQAVKRDKEGKSDDKYKFDENVTCFETALPIAIKHELVRVNCSCADSKILLYEDFRAFIVPKPPKNVSKPSSNSDKNGNRLNIYMIVLDSVSRLNFRRQMPDVEKRLQELGAIPLLGLTKVGRNTLPNMLPLLADMTIDELKQFFSGKPLDGLPIIWKNFTTLGYQTLYTEDESFMSTFNYLQKGFYYTPTDFYMRPLYQAMRDSKFIKKSTKTCINQRPHFDLQVRWLEDFIALPKDVPQFAIVFSNSLSHQGPLTHVHPMQARLDQFLRAFRTSQRFNSSVLLLFSDHGMRLGPIMRTELGGYESRLPFFYVLLPPWYETRHPKRVASLRKNSRRLTTFFDVHATLRTLLADAGGAASSPPSSAVTPPPPMRHPGISLFEPISPERSCEDAAVASHWCTCRARRPLPITSSVVARAALTVVSHINSALLGEVREKCAKLTFVRVLSAWHTISEGDEKQDNSKMRQSFEEVVVQLVTEPGLAEFEATVRCWKGVPPSGAPPKADDSSGEGGDDWLAERCKTRHPMTVMDLSRLNLYRGQSDCIREGFEERLYCYCKNLL